MMMPVGLVWIYKEGQRVTYEKHLSNLRVTVTLMYRSLLFILFSKLVWVLIHCYLVN